MHDTQRAASAIVDFAFFVVIGVLGYHGVLREPSLLSLLTLYAMGRFGVAMNKQTANLVGGAGGGGGPGGSGTSQSGFRAMDVPIRSEPTASVLDPAPAHPAHPPSGQTPVAPPRPGPRPPIPRSDPRRTLVALWHLTRQHPGLVVLIFVIAVISSSLALRTP